jgi:2-oxoglutarate ferredoxin oxidoreductase subunit alpha
VGETYELTVRAFNLSEAFRTPVILLMDEIIGHVNEKVRLPESLEVQDRKRPDVPPGAYRPYKHTEDCVPPMADFGRGGYRFHVTGLAHDETGFPTNDPDEIDRLSRRLQEKLRLHRDEIVDVSQDASEDAELVVFAYGSVARAARQAVEEARGQGLPVGLLRPRTLWPFPDVEVRQLGERVKAILVPEMNLGQMAHEVQCAVGGACPVVSVTRVDGLPLPPAQILERIAAVASRPRAAVTP